jgi:hypothetical protein
MKEDVVAVLNVGCKLIRYTQIGIMFFVEELI